MNQFQVRNLQFSPKFLFILKKHILYCGESININQFCITCKDLVEEHLVGMLGSAIQLFSMLTFMMQLFLQAETTFSFGKLRM